MGVNAHQHVDEITTVLRLVVIQGLLVVIQGLRDTPRAAPQSRDGKSGCASLFKGIESGATQVAHRLDFVRARHFQGVRDAMQIYGHGEHTRVRWCN